jgi:imidazolonepropionase-like amidohydrolase
MPGLVMLHEHLAYGAGAEEFADVAQPQPFSAPRLFLAYGVTTIRTAGTFHPYVDLNVKRRIDTGEMPGPEMFLTAPYLNGPGTRQLDAKPVRTPEEARRAVRYWAQEGFSSIKVHGDVSKEALAAIIDEAHALRLPVTAHLGRTVNCREAAELGIDHLEHGFGPCSNLTTDDLGTDPDGPRARALVQLLVDKRVGLTATPMPDASQVLTDTEIELLHPSMRERYLHAPRPVGRIGTPSAPVPRRVVAFVKSGGLLVLGSDTGGCCGYGHFAGVANHNAVVSLVRYGFTPLEVIRIATLNGAMSLGIADRTGSIAVGKEADLLVVRGDPSVRIEDIKQVETVFNNGVQYDPATLLAAVKGMVGWR